MHISKYFNKSYIIGIIVLIVLCIVFNQLYNITSGFSIQQGYEPTQPIAFSHKIHAGDYQIACQYCHTGAEKGKHAVIPSVNICMNCHLGIRQGTKTGTTEIAKIHKAMEEKKAIEWVKVHNLPDHVFFNHAQHVKVGGIECQQCHGAVQEMEVVKQQSPLSMGWCIDCHRKTDIKFDNKYYDMFLQLHEDIKSGKADKVKVKDIGGLDCQKCHY